ncbi:AAA family ATPase [Rhodococcus sp. NPDC003322]
MRIGVSGPHGTGKTTVVEELCARLQGHTAVDEPYVLLEDDGHEFEFPPSSGDYRKQLRCSLRLLQTPATCVVFDRTPLDFLAYLAASGVDLEAEVDLPAVRAAMAGLDLLVVVPIIAEAEQMLPPAEMPALRRAVDDALSDLVYADPLQLCGSLRVVELSGRLTGRVETVLAALR